MKFSGSKRWTLDRTAIRKGSARVVSPLTGQLEELRWSIQVVPTRLLPISVVECRMAGMGRVAFGYGDSLFYEDSLTQAFAEAWERLWLDALREIPSPDGRLRSSSSGFACGATPAEAELAARSELIERAVYLKAWNERLGWEPIQPAGLLNRVLAVFLENFGWDVALYRLTEAKLGNILCAFGTRTAGGVLFDCAHQREGAEQGQTLTKVLRSLLRSAVVLENKTIPYEPLPERGTPGSHRAFYMEPGNASAFDFLTKRESPARQIELGGYDATQSAVVVDIEGFPCVASAVNASWPSLNWGRESLKEGGNPWPHPLA